MTPRIFAERYALGHILENRLEGTVRVATDARTGASVRLTIAEAPALALKQSHLALERLAHANLAEAIALVAEADQVAAVHEALAPLSEPTPERILDCLPGWLAGLARLHAAGLVHGDLGPQTLGVAADGTPKLANVGRRWVIGQRGDDASPLAAPEARAFARVDGRSDLYMLGMACLAMLGLAPEDAEALGGVWPALVEGLLDSDPQRRFADANAALAALATEAAEMPPRRVSPFVGRRGELEQLIEAAEAAREEGPRRVLLGGEAGIGKTRLMEEARRRLIERGFAIATASAADRQGPYAVWAGIAETLLSRVESAELAPVLALVLPGLGEPASPLEPRAERLRLFRAIATLIELACEQAPLAVFLDDWQAADEGSRELLDYLERALPAVPLCLVIAARDAEGGLPLPRFGTGELGAFYRGVTGRDPDGGSLARLEESTEGHPARAEGFLADAVGTAVAAQGAATATVATLPQLQTRQLTTLPPDAQRLAACAALCGAGAPLALLQGVADLPEAAFFEAAGALAEAGLLASERHGHRLLAPADEALAALAPEEHQQAHSRALAYWRVASQMGAAASAQTLARHALQAGDALQGAHYALEAGREALRLFALDQLDFLLARGSACLEALDAPVALQLGYTQLRGDQARYAGQGGEAEAHYREAIALAESHAPERLPELQTSLGIALNLQSRSDEAEACFHSARPQADAFQRARATAALARHYVRIGRHDAAEAACREVLAQEAPSLYRGEALGLLGLILTTAHAGTHEGLAFLAEAQAIAEATGDRLALNNACMLLGNARMALGQLSAARSAFERYALLCGELGLADERVCAELNLAQVAYEEGRYNEAWRRACTGAASARDAGNRIYQIFGQTYAALAGVQLGHLPEAEQALAEGRAVARELGSSYMLAQVDLAELETAIFLGRFGQAETLGLELLRSGPEGEHAIRLQLLLGQLYELAGEVGTAMSHLAEARQRAERQGSAILTALAQLGLGLSAMRAGQLSVAQERALDVLAIAESAEAMLPQLRAHLLLANVNGLLGYREAMGAHLASADELAQEIASPHWQALVWQMRARHEEGMIALRQKAAAYLQFYLGQLPPLARHEFLRWPERRDALAGRPTTPLRPEMAGGSACDK
ncbi:MAG TPA: AAA family ATPase [Oscillatoriaceae cyanobacterium]